MDFESSVSVLHKMEDQVQDVEDFSKACISRHL